MLYYETRHFQESAKQAGVHVVVGNWAAKLTVQQAEALPPDGPYRKKNYADLRIIVALRWMNRRAVLCLLDVFHRGEREYDSYREDTADYGRRHYEPGISPSLLETWISKQPLNEPGLRDPQSVPEELLPWLQPPEAPEHGDIVIFDSAHWTETFRHVDQTSWSEYRSLLAEIVLRVIGESQFPSFGGYPCVHYFDGNGAGVLFSVHRVQDSANTTEYSGVLLLSAHRKAPGADAVQSVIADNYPGDPSQRRILHRDEIARCARRCYPYDVLGDPQSHIWYEIQRDKTGNLALSVEELHVLRSVSNAAEHSQSLPIFINGRAGSGKSTMLYYLFAGYCARLFRDLPPDGLQLVFLSYSADLLREANSAVQQLLRSNPHFRKLSGAAGDEPLNESVLAGFFQPFRRLLVGMLDTAGRGRFRDHDAINFLRFRSLYHRLPLQEPLAADQEERTRQATERARCCMLPETQRISAELAWHVIRTYLKGWDPEEDDFHPGKYNLLPSEERSVSKEDYKKVYETIWQQWYSQITATGPCWDDQDLIRYILQKELYPQNNLAVFCDEAQDFTRSELRLLMALAVYSRYNLSDPSIRCLPFAFAGDPFQTLNPTGFRWENVRATFTSEVIFRLDADRRSQVKQVNDCELRQNYRSQEAIVRLSNTVLLWRSTILGCDLRPQTPWGNRQGREPEFFILSQNLTSQDLINQLGDVPTILPCEEGEEGSFVESDTELQVVLENVRGRTTNSSTETRDRAMKSFLSPAAAKGREFDKVVLYKFGEHLKGSLDEFLECSGEDMQLEYYMNRLYVAVTRAKTELLIVDTASGLQRLWRFAQNSAPEDFRTRQRDADRWKNALGIVSRGDRFEPKLTPQEKKSEAKIWKDTGMRSRDPASLRRARGYFLDLGESIEAATCEAFAFEFENKQRPAGQRFLSLSRIDDAWRCFWVGHSWRDLVALKPIQASWSSEKHESFEIATWMLSDITDIGAVEKFCQFLGDTCRGDRSRALLSQWQVGVQLFVERVSRLGTDSLPKGKWRMLGDVSQLLSEQGFDTAESSAECFYRADAYSEAVMMWRTLGLTSGREYAIASAYALGFPAGLALLSSVDEHKRILARWNDAGKPGSGVWLTHVLPTLEKGGNFDEALPYYVKLKDGDGMLRCLVALTPEHGHRDVSVVYKDLEVIAQSWMQERQLWPSLARAFYVARPRQNEEEDYDHLSFAKLFSKYLRMLAVSDVSILTVLNQNARVDISIVAEWLLLNYRAVGRKLLTLEEVGAALEKLGMLLVPLAKRFYEEYSNAVEHHLSSVARVRWLVVATRELRLAEQGDEAANPVLNPTQARESRTGAQERSRTSSRSESLKGEIGRKRHDWGIEARLLTEELLNSFPQVQTAIIELVSGPDGHRAEWLRGGNLRLLVSPFRITVFHETKQLQIIDERSDDAIRLNVVTGELPSESQSVKVSRQDSTLQFDLAAFDLKVRVGNARQSFDVSIEHADWAAPVQIRLSREKTEVGDV